MSFTVGGSTPQLTFADATVQNTAALPLTGGSVSADITVNGLTVGRGAGAVSTNTAVGASALQANTTASNNTAVGYQAGYTNATGASNTFLGYQAGYYTTSSNNTFVGIDSGQAITTGAKNTVIGRYDGNTGGLDIRTANNYIVLSDGDGNPRAYWNTGGSFYCPRVYIDTTASGANVYTDSTGLFYRSTSALKYKQDVRDLEDLDISTLRPVRYKSKCEGDDQTKDHLGLIADEAAEAGFEELVSRGAEGEVEGFQYERLTVVLLKKLQVLESEFKAYKEAHP